MFFYPHRVCHPLPSLVSDASVKGPTTDTSVAASACTPVLVAQDTEAEADGISSTDASTGEVESIEVGESRELPPVFVRGRERPPFLSDTTRVAGSTPTGSR